MNIALFLLALFLILYLNHPSSIYSHFEWTIIRYKTTSTTLPSTHGICPGLEDTSKPTLVVARVIADGDTEWLDSLSPKYHLCIYTNDVLPSQNRTQLQVPRNRGHEAMAYLTFIIDNYPQLPAAGMVFIHGSRFAWHNDHPSYDNRLLLEQLNISSALTPLGYHNLRCDWSLSTCDPAESKAQGSLENSVRASLQPYAERVVSDSLLPHAFATLFGAGDERAVKLGRNDAVRSQCCAQFVVSRE